MSQPRLEWWSRTLQSTEIWSSYMGYKLIKEVVAHLVLTKLSGLVWGCFFILTAFDGYEIGKNTKKKDWADSSTGKVCAVVRTWFQSSAGRGECICIPSSGEADVGRSLRLTGLHAHICEHTYMQSKKYNCPELYHTESPLFVFKLHTYYKILIMCLFLNRTGGGLSFKA